MKHDSWLHVILAPFLVIGVAAFFFAIAWMVTLL